MTVRLYRSIDASAPVLTGQVGSLVALLDAILVNGYGSKTAAGWTKAYAGTNKASYRMATSGNTGFYLDVDDSAPVTAKEARMRGYEVMTALATGTGPFPTVAQQSSGDICRKSTSADATARPWYCVADGSCLYLFIDTGDFTAPAYAHGFGFGDFFSYGASDPYRCMISGKVTENSANDYDERLGQLHFGWNALSVYSSGRYTARNYNGIAGSRDFNQLSAMLACSGQSDSGFGPTGGPSAMVAYPNGPDGGMLMAPIYLGQNRMIRGYMKGLWAPLHNQPCGHGDLFSGTGAQAGKSFIALNIKANQNSQSFNGTGGMIFVEYSDTWS